LIILNEPQINYTESLFDINSDVNYIYKECFAKFVNDFNKDTSLRIQDYSKPNLDSEINKYYSGPNFIFNKLDSSQLKSKVCKKAHKNNPVPIYTGAINIGSFYKINSPKFISISINTNAFAFLKSNTSLDRLSITQRKTLYNEITEHRIKSSIAHELSHWIDDSLYQVFSRLMDEKDRLVLKKFNVNMEYFEIQGQIHGIAALKRKIKSLYDDLDIYDLFSKYTALSSIANTLIKQYNSEVFHIWLKYLLKRMSREDLLTKKIANSHIVPSKFIESV
jgi:hypothetical protein